MQGYVFLALAIIAEVIATTALKSVDGLTSFGAGFAVNFYKWREGRSLWTDVAPFYDGPSKLVGGFLGASTEIVGLPIIEPLLKPLGATCIGIGGKYDGTDYEVTAYASWHIQ